MFDIEGFKQWVIEKYRLEKGNLPLYIKHFLGDEFQINLPELKYSNMKSISEREATIELTSKNGRIAKVYFDNYLYIDFYDMCQSSKVLYASMRVINIGEVEDFRIVEFNCDGSVTRSEISANHNYDKQLFDGKRKSKIVTYNQLKITIDYYDPENIKYFDDEDKNVVVFSSFNSLKKMFFEPEHSAGVEKESPETYSGESIISELLSVKEELDCEIINGGNESILQHILRSKQND